MQPILSTAVAAQLHSFTQASLLAITNAADPCLLSTKDFNVEVPTVKIDKIVDTTGAGDAFLGTDIIFSYSLNVLLYSNLTILVTQKPIH